MDIENKFKLPIELPEPWHWTTHDFSEQLQKEVYANHPMYQMRVKTIARRQDKDDFLYQLLDNNEYAYAVVHLTFSNNRHDDGRYPITRFYKNWQDVYTNCILKDKVDFE